MLKLIAIAVLSCFASCVATPTQAQIDSADIGPKPSMLAAQRVARTLIKKELRNPETAIFHFADSVERGYYNPNTDSLSSPAAFGWVLGCNVLAKDSYGRYAGEQLWKIYFRENGVVASSLLVDYRGAYAVTEFNPPLPLN